MCIISSYLNSNSNELFDLNFSTPRTPIQMEQSALETVLRNNLLSFLFPTNSGNYNFNHNIERLKHFYIYQFFIIIFSRKFIVYRGSTQICSRTKSNKLRLKILS